MKVTWQGVAIGLIITCLSIPYYLNIAPIVLAATLACKYLLLGDDSRVTQLLYKATNVVSDFTEDAWFVLVATLLELVHRTRLAYTVVDHNQSSSSMLKADGTSPDLSRVLSRPSQKGKVKLVLVNHHCRLDWVYLFMFFARSRSAGASLRFVLKEDLSRIFFWGWVMQQFRFFFLSRSWQSDEQYLREMVAYTKRTGDACTVLIFPEGTDLSLSNVEKSRAFAKREGLPEFLHVLNPRTTGLVALKNMFGAENIEEIVDCTMGYTYGKGGKRPSEPSLIDGSHAAKVHLLIRRYAVGSEASPTTAPSGDEALAAWIHERFMDKEALLSRFYRNSPVGFDHDDVRQVYGDDGAAVIASYDDDTPQNAQMGYAHRFVREVGIWRGVVRQVLVWIIGSFCFLYMYPKWLVLLCYAAILYGMKYLIGRNGGLQRLLFIRRVSKEETLLSKMRAAKPKKS